jgi:thiol-disulfide isomerase/thioredoxin
MKTIQWVFIVGLLALGGGIVAGKYLFTGENTEQQTLPAISLVDLAGNPHALTEWQGKFLVINFWATWCPPCRQEIPEFIALQEQYADRGVQVIGIALDDRDAVAEYLEVVKIKYPTLIGDSDGIVLSEQLGNNAQTVPFTVIVSPDNQIIFRQRSETSKEEIIKIIMPLIVN